MIYTIDYLLNKQPKALQKDPRFRLMMNSLEETPALRERKFNRRCYSLLHNGVIRPEHLQNFYRTYRLPKHPFFALFFDIKRDYLKKRERLKKERENYILCGQKELPPMVRQMQAQMIKLEQKAHFNGQDPLCRLNFSVKTRKQIDLWNSFSHDQWIVFFDHLLQKLMKKYPRIPQNNVDNLLALFILQSLIPKDISLWDSKTAKSNFRRLSREYHPDTGGNSPMFIKIKWARDQLGF